MRRFLAFLLVMFFACAAHAQTQAQFGLQTGSNPRALGVYDQTHTFVPFANMDSTGHTLTFTGPATLSSLTIAGYLAATTSGTLTNGHCVSINAAGNLVDAGGPCTTVNPATAGQLAYYTGSTAISGTLTGTGVLTALGNTAGAAGGFATYNQLGSSALSVLNASGSAMATTGSIASGTYTLSLTSALDFKTGQGVRINTAGPISTIGAPVSLSAAPQGATGSTTYSYAVASFDCSGGLSAVSSASTVTGPAALTTVNYNKVTWSPPGGTYPCGFAVWRTAPTAAFIGVTAATLSYVDNGAAPLFTPDWVPTSPPGSATAQYLVTTVLAGGGTSSLTVAASASSSVVGGGVYHDDTIALQTAINARASAGGGEIAMPCGTFNTSSSLVLPVTNAVNLHGCGRGYPNATVAASLNFVGATYYGVINSQIGWLYGHRVADMTINGNGLAQYDLYLPQIDGATFEHLTVANAGYINIQVGNGTANTVENSFYNIRIDNNEKTHLLNLPIENFVSYGTNNNFLHIKASNAAYANLVEEPSASGNTYVAVHGYNYLNATTPAQPPSYNFYIAGTGSQFSVPEADGAALTDVYFAGWGNMMTGAYTQFDGVANATCFGFASGVGENTVTNSMCNSSATTVNQALPTGANGNIWHDITNTVTGAVASSGYILGQTTVGALPACGSGTKGYTYAVTDALAPSWNSTLSGGGAVVVEALCNGSIWTAH